MAITKIQSESLNLSDTYNFTGTVTGAGGVNTPAFQAYLGSNQSFSQNTYQKVNFNSETFDTDSAYDSVTNYRFTPAVSGKYFLYASVRPSVTTDFDDSLLQIRKNGTAIAHTGASNFHYTSVHVNCTIDSDTDDYFEVFYYTSNSGGVNLLGNNNAQHETHFGGYKIIT